MKAMKKLVPAFCLLLISAVLMGTSTYAWFTMNAEVHATGMKVTASTPKSLYIDTDEAMTNKGFTKAAKVNTTSELKPTSVNVEASSYAQTWYSATAADESLAGVDTNGYTALSSDETVLKGYRRLDTFYVQSVDDPFSDFGVKSFTLQNGDNLAVEGGSVDLLKALKMMVVVTNTKDSTIAGVGHYTLNPDNANGETNAKYVTSAATKDGEGKVTNPGTTANNRTCYGSTNCANNKIVASLDADTVYKVEIYIYFDGEDSACTSVNVNKLNVDGVTVAVDFGECKAVSGS